MGRSGRTRSLIGFRGSAISARGNICDLRVVLNLVKSKRPVTTGLNRAGRLGVLLAKVGVERGLGISGVHSVG